MAQIRTNSIVSMVVGGPDEDQMAGAVLAERYRLLRVLGRGAMGQVYEAEQLGLGRSVAVKLMRTGFTDARGIERFRNEALAASRINHPNAVAIFDFGVTSERLPYLVMERLRGRALSQLIAERPLHPARAATIGAQILSAAAEAHSCGVVHRDLKSDNVVIDTMRDGSDFAKVLDFGLARLVDVAGAEDAGDAGISGTPEYMAPEQIRGEPAAPSADLYAIAVIVFEMLVGRTPFVGGGVHAVLNRHLHDPVPPPHRLAPDCPLSLSALIVRALDKDPAQRFADAQAMREALLATLRDARQVAAPLDELDEGFAQGSAPTVVTAARDTIQRLGANVAVQATELSIRPAAVGRDDDRALLRRFLRGESSDAALAIVGPDGVGKTRLVLDVADELDGHVPVFVATPDPTGLAQPWRPVLAMLEAVLGLTPRPTLDELADAVDRCALPERDVPGLAELFALPGPLAGLELAVRRREAQAAALRALASVHLHRPRAVLCFLDLDRYDTPSRALIRTLAETAAGDGTRLVTTADGEAAAPPGAAIHVLEPLSPDDGHTLACRLSAAATALTPAALHFATGGLPAAIENLIGWLRAGNDPSTAPERLVDLVAVRVGQLSVPERRVLQAIAAEGKEAPAARVAAFVGEVELAAALPGLQGTALVVVDGEQLRIPHDLVVDVAAACTPADVRRERSRALLATFDRDTPPAVIAHHAERADDLVSAAMHYLVAGDDAVRRFDDPGAARWYLATMRVARRLAAQGEDAAAAFVSASLRLADVLRFTGELRLAAGCLDEAELFGPDLVHLTGLARARGRIALAAGEADRARRHLADAIGLAYRRGDREFLCETYLDLASALAQAGAAGEAIRELSEAVDALTLGEGLAAASDPPRLWLVGLRLAELELAAGHLDAAREVARDALSFAVRIASVVGQARLHTLLSVLAARAGDDRAAVLHRGQALTSLRRLGDRQSIAELLLMAEDDDAAAELADEIGWTDGAARARHTRDTVT